MTVTYQGNQAFERAYEFANVDYRDQEWIDRILEYSKNSDRLQDFIGFEPFVIWFEELYLASQGIIKKLLEINNDMENSKTDWFGLWRKKKKIENLFEKLHSLDEELNTFRADSVEFQQCVLARDIHHATEYVDLLQEQVQYMDHIESKIRQTGDRKLININNTRMQAIGLFLSVTAIAISVYSFVFTG